MVATSYGNMKEYLWSNILDLNLMKKSLIFFSLYDSFLY